MEPELTIIAISFWMILLLIITSPVYLLVSMWKLVRSGGPFRTIIWFTVAIVASTAVIALVAGYVQTVRSSEKISIVNRNEP